VIAGAVGKRDGHWHGLLLLAVVLVPMIGLVRLAGPSQVTRARSPARTLGPGELAYLPVGARVADLDHVGDVREVAVASLGGWLDSLSADDVDESSVAEMEQVLVLCRGEDVLGAAGHLIWPAETGHIGVLVAPSARGAGVGTRLGAAATREALDRGLTPQWRAAGWNDASRRIARRIGYREMGRQFSFQLGQLDGSDRRIGRREDSG
jgi:GNAT superfamily N-acetyltransferase